jgi:acetylornithine/succinyldiaminopimelate/putrescine aminotransferase
MTHLMNTYKRQDVAFVRGEGAWLEDSRASAISTR